MPRRAILSVCFLPLLFVFGVRSQQPASLPPPVQLDSSGQIELDGRPTNYLIRRLPVSSFPQLPEPLQAALILRGCLIPQTFEAHRPENVIHASLERAGSDDWALLCSVNGQVSLLVAFGGSPDALVMLASFPEMSRLQARAPTGLLGFNWAIDPASPSQVHQARAGMRLRPAPIDHDALADSMVERRTIYHYFTRSNWTRLEMPE